MSATTVAPSPQKSTSLKRPQTDGSTPQDLSNAISPDQSFKKARLNGDDSNGVKDLGKGGRWMVEKLEELERLYKAVVKAATIILQYQAFAIRLGKDAQKLPVHLRRRINIAWGSYEASRRQVQAYIDESAQQATTPSSRQFAIPIPPPNASLSVPVIGTSNLPLASPIPLSAATMLSFDHPASGNVEQQSGTQTASATADTKPFSFDMLQNSNQVGNDNNNGMFDLQGMNLGGPNGMSEFAAMLQQGSQDFTLEGLMGNINAQPPTAPDQAQNQQQPVNTQEIPTQNAVSSENTDVNNDDTDQILAQLGAFAAQDGQAPDSGAIPDQTSAGMGDDDINALIASLGDTDGQDFTNFDFSSNLDMGNLGEMAGLFNTTTTVDSDLKPDVPPEAPVKVEGAAAETQVPVIDNNATTAQPKQEEQAPQPAPASENNDFTAIDLDDFNFGDGDEAQEGMGMSGDEFDRLLAGAFND